MMARDHVESDHRIFCHKLSAKQFYDVALWIQNNATLKGIDVVESTIAAILTNEDETFLKLAFAGIEIITVHDANYFELNS